MTTLVLSNSQWRNIKERIMKEYGAATILISWKLKRELGFSVRSHSYYDNIKSLAMSDTRLDFDDPVQATYFQLKYL